MIRYLAFSLLFCLTILTVFAQEGTPEIDTKVDTKESPDTATIFYTVLTERWPSENVIRLNDSILRNFQFYLPTEGPSTINAITGNAGLAYQSLVFDLPDMQGFRFTPFDFKKYKLHNYNLRYYQTTGPYSAISYTTGAGKEQTFNVTHSQNIAGGLTMGLDVAIINSVGLYERQKSDNTSFAGTAQYVSKNENYVALANYHSSKMKWRENGGISREILFRENVETDRKRIPVNLANADNFMKESGFFLRHFYYLGKLNKVNPVTDSLQSDTAGPKKIHRYYNPIRSNFIRHTFSYTRNSYNYKDQNPLSGFYEDAYISNDETVDSIFYRELSNDISIEAGIGKAKGSSRAILLRVGVEHAASIYKNDSIQNTFNRLTLYGYLSANAFGYALAEGRIWNTQGNPFNGDKGIEGSLTFPGYDNSQSWGNLKVNVSLTASQPFYLYQYHYSNNFKWDNAFGQQTTFSAKATYSRDFFKAGFNAFSLTDYVYLNLASVPNKRDESIAITQAWASTDIIWRHFEIQLYGVFQNSSLPSVISLPEFAGRASASFNTALFKRALYLNTGLSLMYNTEYFADAYSPALRAFHVQNTVKTGNYPYVDAFLNIRVKRAKMFLMMKHVNSGLLDYNYFMVPSYPMPDRGLRFGISWAFYD